MWSSPHFQTLRLSIDSLNVVIIYRFSTNVTVVDEDDHHALENTPARLPSLWDLFADSLHTDVGWELSLTPWRVYRSWQTEEHFRVQVFLTTVLYYKWMSLFDIITVMQLKFTYCFHHPRSRIERNYWVLLCVESGAMGNLWSWSMVHHLLHLWEMWNIITKITQT